MSQNSKLLGKKKDDLDAYLDAWKKKKKWKYGEPDRNHNWQTGIDQNTQRRTENQYRQAAQNQTFSNQYQYRTSTS